MPAAVHQVAAARMAEHRAGHRNVRAQDTELCVKYAGDSAGFRTAIRVG